MKHASRQTNKYLSRLTQSIKHFPLHVHHFMPFLQVPNAFQLASQSVPSILSASHDFFQVLHDIEEKLNTQMIHFSTFISFEKINLSTFLTPFLVGGPTNPQLPTHPNRSLVRSATLCKDLYVLIKPGTHSLAALDLGMETSDFVFPSEQ